MWPDRVSNPGPLTYESGALLIALRSPVINDGKPIKEHGQQCRPISDATYMASDQCLLCLP